MPLIKIKDGLLERENFFIHSNIGDFIGNGEWIKINEDFLLRKGTIKRKFDFNKFVIEISKKASELSIGEEILFFIENEDGEIFGIKEEKGNDLYTNLKIIVYDDFVQVYASKDEGLSWKNIGGTNFKGKIKYQGFTVSNCNLLIYDYKVYESPYLTIQNFDKDVLCKLLDTNNIIKERLFDEKMICEIFLDTETEGILDFSKGDIPILTTDTINFKPGDVFLYTPYSLEIIYKEKIINYKTTFLEKAVEKVAIKNIDIETYYNLNLLINNQNIEDDVQISFDNTLYSKSLKLIKIEPNEEIDLYIRIIKKYEPMNFYVRNFSLEIY